MEKEITKEELKTLLDMRAVGNQNIAYLKDLLGEEVFEFMSKSHSSLKIIGPWSNSQDGQHYVTVNFTTGKIDHECSIAAVALNILLIGNKYEKEYRDLILKATKNQLETNPTVNK